LSNATKRVEITRLLAPKKLVCRHRRRLRRASRLQLAGLADEKRYEKKHYSTGGAHQQRHTQAELLGHCSSKRRRHRRTDDFAYQRRQPDGRR
jgi:hypothetical protein